MKDDINCTVKSKSIKLIDKIIVAYVRVIPLNERKKEESFTQLKRLSREYLLSHYFYSVMYFMGIIRKT